jgi:hypothetical protein
MKIKTKGVIKKYYQIKKVAEFLFMIILLYFFQNENEFFDSNLHIKIEMAYKYKSTNSYKKD